MASLIALAVVILSAILVADVKAQCEDGWTYWQSGNKCIKPFNDVTYGWKDAMYHCISQEGRLVTIHDNAIHDFVSELVKNENNFYWIGLTGFRNGNVFRWVDGTTMSDFSNWGEGQPDSYIGNEYCVHLRPDFYWNDFNCGSNQAFICEKRGPGCQHMNGGCPNDCNDGKNSEWKVSCSKNCDPGYAEVDGNCYDINECSLNNGGCDQNCLNEEGSFGCECSIDYIYNGTHCVIDDGTDTLIG